ncbi:alpha/beta hydrolase [Thalassotalea euphylliae]|nr:alpha/beta hydrolase [Thalassotalea euphylliae]
MQNIQLKTKVGELAANLCLPQNANQGSEKLPVVIVTGAWTTVKEQMPAVYARALAEQGYAALTFDFRGWGESTDKTQYLEDPQRKIADIQAVIDAVQEVGDEFTFVDTKRIAGLGICASAGYMLDAVLANEGIKTVAVVAPWLHDKTLATAIYGGEENVNALLAAAQNAEQSELLVTIEAASLTNQSALMYQAPYYTETDRGLIPAYDNLFNVASWQGWLNYDALQNAEAQDKPVLMVASDAMALPAGTKQYLDKAGANVQAIWLDGISQFDFYDQPSAVTQALQAIDTHFSKHL